MLILIVDDSKTARSLFCEVVAGNPEFQGCTVEQAKNGIDGLAKFRASAPDVVVADINMPGMDGFELLQAIKAAASGKTRFGFLTADRSPGTRDMALARGADFFINKGCTVKTLHRAIMGGN